mmetsp:Transcript_3636/g.10558  ORF Transcript_3636/g.10558 Transcript_3636/m.10558 type:complete len:201 (-) Transcript_3636:4384-4986(-)
MGAATGSTPGASAGAKSPSPVGALRTEASQLSSAGASSSAPSAAVANSLCGCSVSASDSAGGCSSGPSSSVPSVDAGALTSPLGGAGGRVFRQPPAVTTRSCFKDCCGPVRSFAAAARDCVGMTRPARGAVAGEPTRPHLRWLSPGVPAAPLFAFVGLRARAAEMRTGTIGAWPAPSATSPCMCSRTDKKSRPRTVPRRE